MKKSVKKLISLFCAALLMLSLCACGAEKAPAPAESAEPEAPAESAAPAETSAPEESAGPEEPAETEEPAEAEPLNMETALFIGDSRSVGLYEYAGLPSDFFADAGMSVYNIFDNYSDVGGRGFTQLKPLLEKNDYETIFLMLGLNEIGFPFDEVMVKFGELVDYLRSSEPDSKIIIMANLHVTKDYSDGHPYITNPNIDALNELMGAYADGENIFLLDVNPVYDDENGALKAELTSDGVHFYAKHYLEWGQWIAQESGKLFS